MARHGFTRLRLVAACAVLAGGLTPLLPGTAVADPQQETVVPATPRNTYLSAGLYARSTYSGHDGAGAQGVFHSLEGQGLVWTRYADGTSVPVPRSADAPYSAASGDVLQYRYPGNRTLDLWNAADGSRRTLRVPEGLALLTAYEDLAIGYRDVTDANGVSRRETHLLLPDADGGTRDVPVTGVPEGVHLGQPHGGDADGLLFRAGKDGQFLSVMVDRRTGEVTDATPLTATPYSKAQVTGKHVVLFDVGDRTVLVHDRSDLSAVPTQVTLAGSDAYPPQDIAVVGDWLVHRPGGGTTVYAKPISGGPGLTVLQDANLGISAVHDGTAVAIGRTGADDWGIWRIHAGPDGRPVVTQVKPLPRPPAPVQGISLDQGRLVVADSSRGERDDYVRTVTTHGTPEFGERTSFTPGTSGRFGNCAATDVACSPLFGTADGRIAWLEHDSAQQDVIMVQGPEGLWQRPVPPGGRITDVSGDHVIHRTATQQTVHRIGHYDPPVLTRAPVAAALSGSLLWSAGPALGSVTAYDVATRKTTESLSTDAGCAPDELQALGRYLYWTCDGRAGVYDRTARKSVPVPTGEAKLGDGYVVTHDKAAGKLTLTTVDDGTPVSRVIGDLPDTGVSQRDVRWTVDESGANAAYVDGRQRVHLVPSGVTQQPLRLLVPARNAGSLQARSGTAEAGTLTTVLLSKPAAGWELTIRDKATGRIVGVQEGGVARGELRISWTGRGSQGEFFPNGAYDWTLTVTPADGAGAPLQTRGTVRLHGGSPVRRDHAGPSGIVDGVGDLLTLDSHGRLTFHRGTGTGGFSGQLTESGWPTSVKAIPVGDLNGDRCNDVLVKYSGGTVRLYKPACNAPMETSTPYTTIATGTGWNQYDVLTSPGDVTKDGRPDLIARTTATGGVYLYKGTSTGKFAPRVKLYDNWKTYKKVVGAGDLNGDGIGDLVAQDKTNALYRYHGTGKGTFASRVKLSAAWGVSYDAVVGAGDINGDGTADLVARDTTGALYRIPGTGQGSFGTRARIGTGWQVYRGVF
ncbi:FG-GAP-like repeat-containing protein [Streptomyces sp. NPDC052023]|uniref:FG-GAP-like repeat-containing protein n=1 Tax=Streptomyces sp. NPDC052023 TaxID=3365681 RepID=UPI0037D6F8AE